MFAITYPAREQLIHSVCNAQRVGALLVIAMAWPNFLFAAADLGAESINGIEPTSQQQKTVSSVFEEKLDPVNDYLDAIDKAALDGGAYSLELADLYLGLGNSLLKGNEYDRAKLAFQRGMQVERVNNGLNSTAQIPYLFSIAEIDQRQGNNKALKKALNNIYKVNTANYGPEDERRLPILSRLYDWYLESYKHRVLKADHLSLLASAELASQIVNIVEINKGLDDPVTVESLRTVTQVNYLIVEHLNAYGEYENSEPSGYSYNSDTQFKNSLAKSNESLRTGSHYRRGKEALSKVVESIGRQQLPVADQAKAIAELGDWYLFFGFNQSAIRTYQMASQLLLEDENSQQLQENIFGRPRQINFMPPSDIDNEVSFAEVSIYVSPYGKVRNVQILEPPYELKISEIKTIKRTLRSKRFRPSIVDGKLQETKDYKIHYPLEKRL
jgi:hypothetical protein